RKYCVSAKKQVTTGLFGPFLLSTPVCTPAMNGISLADMGCHESFFETCSGSDFKTKETIGAVVFSWQGRKPLRITVRF
ncbi:MAG: hypothetical protein WAO76_11390, partial [Georgfuchsia sp.]